MIQFFARVVELREEKYVKYDGKVTTDSPPREFLEVTCCLPQCGGHCSRDTLRMGGASPDGQYNDKLLFTSGYRETRPSPLGRGDGRLSSQVQHFLETKSRGER